MRDLSGARHQLAALADSGRTHAPLLRTTPARLGVLAGPLFVEGVAAISEQLVATACVGQLADASALAALILAESVYNVSAVAVAVVCSSGRQQTASSSRQQQQQTACRQDGRPLHALARRSLATVL